ncbi:MAG TPA: hypothetical protein VHQ70_11185 [Syntrophomonadaceae bacterium]|nr:hypothetical protein [Syntrophomonadaceae bacterium]
MQPKAQNSKGSKSPKNLKVTKPSAARTNKTPNIRTSREQSAPDIGSRISLTTVQKVSYNLKLNSTERMDTMQFATDRESYPELYETSLEKFIPEEKNVQIPLSKFKRQPYMDASPSSAEPSVNTDFDEECLGSDLEPANEEDNRTPPYLLSQKYFGSRF